MIEFGWTSTINNIECYSVIRVVKGSEEDSEDQVEWLPALLLAYNNKITIPVAEKEHEELVKDLLEKYPQIIFINEKNTTMTDRIQYKIYMKHETPFRSGVRTLRYYKREWLWKEVDELLRARVIQLSRSPYVAAPVIVLKKDGTL